jgi:hypothetical protein
VRNTAGVITGMWIAEDNSITSDDGGTPLPSGGWRLSTLAFCGAATFERWLPENWPGHGTFRHFDVSEDFCPSAGSTYQVDVLLPVELVGTVSATTGDGAVTLHWATASETGVLRFEIIRAGSIVGSVSASGQSAVRRDYSWTESNLDNGAIYAYTLRAINQTGQRYDLATVNAVTGRNNAAVTEFALKQNYPNPFNPSTQIRFDLPERARVEVKVFNTAGQLVATLMNETKAAGSYSVQWNGEHAASGIYLCQMKTDKFTDLRKMVLIK